MEPKHYKARIEWYNDPSHYSLHTWVRDIVTIDGVVVDRQIIDQRWTVPVRITSFIDDTWCTYADVGLKISTQSMYNKTHPSRRFIHIDG